MSTRDEKLFYELLADKIFEARRKSGLTQQQLAIAANIKRTTMVNIENKRQCAMPHQIDAIRGALDLEIGELWP